MRRPFLAEGQWRVGHSPVLILSQLPPSVLLIVERVGRTIKSQVTALESS